MSEWTSPGGLYCVPTDFQVRFLAEFPEYRIRWSLQRERWQIEQRCGQSALPPIRVSEEDDSLIRARDGYWLVMEFQPGDRMPCPAWIGAKGGQRCGWTLKVPHRRAAETVCQNCRQHGRDGRVMASYWPFDECLLEQLRKTDPLRVFTGSDADGHTRSLNGIQRARVEADKKNKQLLATAEKKRLDAASIDYVDYRWLTGIGASGAQRRRVDSQTFR